MEKWEYRIVTLGSPGAEEKLNVLGQEGWELVAIETIY